MGATQFGHQTVGHHLESKTAMTIVNFISIVSVYSVVHAIQHTIEKTQNGRIIL